MSFEAAEMPVRAGRVLFRSGEIECRVVESETANNKLSYHFYRDGKIPFAEVWLLGCREGVNGEAAGFLARFDVKPLLRRGYTVHVPILYPYFGGEAEKWIKNWDRLAVLKEVLEDKLVELALIPCCRDLQLDFLKVLLAVRSETKRVEAERKALERAGPLVNPHEEEGGCSC